MSSGLSSISSIPSRSSITSISSIFFIIGKTLGESGADLDRMFLISAVITKAFRGDSGVHARYMVVRGQAETKETMTLHLSPDEQRLVAQALAEQRIRLGPQA